MNQAADSRQRQTENKYSIYSGGPENTESAKLRTKVPEMKC